MKEILITNKLFNTKTNYNFYNKEMITQYK